MQRQSPLFPNTKVTMSSTNMAKNEYREGVDSWRMEILCETKKSCRKSRFCARNNDKKNDIYPEGACIETA